MLPGLPHGILFPQASSAYNPATMPGLAHWYDFSDDANVTKSGGLFTAAADKAGSANTAPTSGREPIVSSMNGLQAAEFNGNKEIFAESGVNSAFSSEDRTFTFIISVQPSLLSEVHTVFSLSNTTASNQLYSCRALASPNVWSFFKRSNNGISKAVNSSSSVDTAAPHVITWVTGAAGQTLDMYDGLTQVMTGQNIDVPGMVSINRLMIGNLKVGSTLGGDNLHGTIGEVLVSNQRLTGTDLTDAINYMLGKWT